jgi:hypothetical protein
MLKQLCAADARLQHHLHHLGRLQIANPKVHQFSGAEFKSFWTYSDAQSYLSANAHHITDHLPTCNMS